MTLTLAEAIADITGALPVAASLTASPDTAPAGPRGRPGSTPPWNSEAANLVWGAQAVIADHHAMFAYLVHRRHIPRHTYAGTGAALDAIGRLGEAVPHDRVRQAARELYRAAQQIQMLPAVDEAERPQKVTWPCPYCALPMVRLYPRAATVVCLRGGFACWDSDGNAPLGRAEVGRLGPCVVWADGLVS